MNGLLNFLKRRNSMNKFYRRATAFFLLVLYACAFTLSTFAVIADGQTVKKELVLSYESCPHL